MARRPDGSTERRWQERLRRQKLSGLTVAEFCDCEGVSTASFYAWKRRLHSGGMTVGQARRRRSTAVPRITERDTGGQPLFVPVSVKPAAGDVRIDLPGGAAVTIPADTDERLVRACIRAAAEIEQEPENAAC